MTSHRRLPAERDRAVARLRTLTRGAAVSGVLGTLLFGAVAAASYDGTATTHVDGELRRQRGPGRSGRLDDRDDRDDRRLERQRRQPAPGHAGAQHLDDVGRRARLDRRLMTETASAGWRALGTGVRLVVHGGRPRDGPGGRRGRPRSRSTGRYSRFRADSELVALHDARAGEAVRVSARSSPTRSRSALRAAEQHRAAPSTRRSGGRCARSATTRDFADARRTDGPDRAPPRADPRLADRRAVAGPRARSGLRRGVELDLGSTGKALAADLAAAAALAAIDRPGAASSSRSAATSPTAGIAPDGGWRILVAEDSEAPADADGETVAIPGGRDRDLEHDRPPLAARRPGRSTTSSTRGPGSRSTRRGGPSPSSRPRASTRTPRRPPRSSAATPASSWLAATGLPARLVDADGADRPRSTAGRSRPDASALAVAPAREHPDPVVRHARLRHRLPDPLQRRRLPRAAGVARAQSAAWPRFLTVELHRNLALSRSRSSSLHIVTAILDPFTSLGIAAAVIPLASSYRPLPVALGVISVDLAARDHRHEPAPRSDRPPGLAGRPLGRLRRVAARRRCTRSRPAATRSRRGCSPSTVACVLAVGACLLWRLTTGARTGAGSRP